MKARRDLREFGGLADGATNAGPAMLAAVTAAVAARRASSGNAIGTMTIELPAGDFLITDPQGFLGQEANSTRIVGLRFVGQGAGITTIKFQPPTAADLCFNSSWQFLQFENITFNAVTTGCTFMHSSTTNSAQNFRFINCTFANWKYIAFLEGDQNNSEWEFRNCSSSGTSADGAWLKIPSANSSDQFLNFWWWGGSHQNTSAPLIDAAKGGSFYVNGVDCSSWGAGLSAPAPIFKLMGTSHSYGVCNIQVNGLRVEAKSANAQLLYSEWPSGNVSFRGVDWSSQAGTFTYGDVISLNFVNVTGPHYVFRDSVLAGGIKVAYQSNDYLSPKRILVDDCTWLQKVSPSDVVTYDTSGAGSSLAKPAVAFNRCSSPSAGNALDVAGMAVWDAAIGYQGDLVQTLVERCVSLRGIYGLPNGGSLVVRLPVGALVTGFKVISPSGAVAEADGGTWTLATSEGTPTTIASATVASALSAGYVASDASVDQVAPFLCSTTARATLKVTPSNVSQQNSGGGLILIKGYW
jgi:hypothetical protein